MSSQKHAGNFGTVKTYRNESQSEPAARPMTCCMQPPTQMLRVQNWIVHNAPLQKLQNCSYSSQNELTLTSLKQEQSIVSAVQMLPELHTSRSPPMVQ